MRAETSKYNTCGGNEQQTTPEHRAVVRLSNRLGMHMRSAGAFVQEADRFEAEILVAKFGQDDYVDGRSILDLVTLCAPKGTKLEIVCRGEDAKEALDALVALVNRKFGED